jgi:hypothetical protein
MSAKEPTSFGRDIDQLSRFGKIDGDDDKTRQYDTSVVMGPENLDFSLLAAITRRQRAVMQGPLLVVSQCVHRICILAPHRQPTLDSGT